MIYPRKLKKRIEKELENNLAVVITGMRRVGKTFLLRDIFQGIAPANKLFLDLEKPENARVFKKDSFDETIRNLEFLGISFKERSWIFLDEIQRVRFLPSVIKYISDHYNAKFVVSGSSSFYLKNLFSESLSGRKIIFNLGPLDFGEFLVFRGVKVPEFIPEFWKLKELNTEMITAKYESYFEEYLKIGGFPQAVLAQNEEARKSILRDILYSYLDLDVRSLSDIKGVAELEKLINLLPPRIGQKVDVQKLSSIVGISRITTKAYLEFLKDTFIASLVYPYSLSPDREVSATPKLYFCDNGLAGILADISEGQKLENFVHTALSKRFFVNYYQRKSGVEIDFILDKKIGVEVKSFGDERDLRRLSSISDYLKLEGTCVFSKIRRGGLDSNIISALLLGFLSWQ